MTCSGELYRALDVEKEATTEEIHQAYRRKALELHPDRTGGTTTAEFQLIQQANEVLSDPHTRVLYNALGREGMATMSSKMFTDPSEINPVIGCAVTCVLLLINVCLLIFTALVVANIDRGLGYRWAAVFTPLWIIFVPLLIGAIVSIVVSARLRSLSVAIRSLFVVCFIIAVVLLALALDTTVPWAPVFYYYFSVQGAYILVHLPYLLPSLSAEEAAANGSSDTEGCSAFTATLYVCNLARYIVVPILNLIFIILLYLRIVEPEFSRFSLYRAFAPLYAAIALQGVASTFKVLVLTAAAAIDEPALAISSACRACCGTIFFTFVVGYTPMLISIKAQRELNEFRAGPSAAVCAIIAFIFFGLAVLVSCCASIAAICAPLLTQKSSQEDEGQSQGV